MKGLVVGQTFAGARLFQQAPVLSDDVVDGGVAVAHVGDGPSHVVELGPVEIVVCAVEVVVDAIGAVAVSVEQRDAFLAVGLQHVQPLGCRVLRLQRTTQPALQLCQPILRVHVRDSISCAGGRHNMPRPLQVDLLTLKVVSESRVMWPTSVPIFVFLSS